MKYAWTPDNVLVISDKRLVVVSGPFVFVFFFQSVTIFVSTLVLRRAQCLSSASGSSKECFFSFVVLFYSQTESLHKTAEMVGMRVGLIGLKKRVSVFVFTLCNKHNCVIKKNRICFPTHLEIAFSFLSCCLFLLSWYYTVSQQVIELLLLWIPKARGWTVFAGNYEKSARTLKGVKAMN